jgi:hypothetical protein
MPKVVATPFIGLRPLTPHTKIYDGPDQPPEDAVIGECVGEAVRSAWKAGNDPASADFVVIVSFE